MIEITDPFLRMRQEVLWKDVWWIKSILLFLMFVSLWATYKILTLVFKFLDGKRRKNTKNHGLLPPPFPKSPVTLPVITEASKRDSQQQYCTDSTGFLRTNQNKSTFKADDSGGADQFYDLMHHGIEFYNDNVPHSSRQHRQRMHSTVSSSSSMLMPTVRHRQQLRVNPPAFPKINESRNEGLSNASSKKPYNDQHFCSGDMKFTKQVFNHTQSRLSTVLEENISDTTLKFEISNCNTNNNTLSSGGMIPAMNPFPSLVTDTLATESTNVECLICTKTKIHCLCKKCSSLCLQEGDRKGFNNEGGNTNGDDGRQDDFLNNGFIDDNFEDMESIISDENMRESKT